MKPDLFYAKCREYDIEISGKTTKDPKHSEDQELSTNEEGPSNKRSRSASQESILEGLRNRSAEHTNIRDIQGSFSSTYPDSLAALPISSTDIPAFQNHQIVDALLASSRLSALQDQARLHQLALDSALASYGLASLPVDSEAGDTPRLLLQQHILIHEQNILFPTTRTLCGRIPPCQLAQQGTHNGPPATALMSHLPIFQHASWPFPGQLLGSSLPSELLNYYRLAALSNLAASHQAPSIGAGGQSLLEILAPNREISQPMEGRNENLLTWKHD